MGLLKSVWLCAIRKIRGRRVALIIMAGLRFFKPQYCWQYNRTTIYLTGFPWGLDEVLIGSPVSSTYRIDTALEMPFSQIISHPNWSWGLIQQTTKNRADITRAVVTKVLMALKRSRLRGRRGPLVAERPGTSLAFGVSQMPLGGLIRLALRLPLCSQPAIVPDTCHSEFPWRSGGSHLVEEQWEEDRKWRS